MGVAPGEAAGEAARDQDPRASQPGLFILWERSRALQDRILADLAQRFQILHAYEVHWSPKRVPTNFQRFYSDLDVRGIYHVFNKGAGPFLAVTLLDLEPLQETRPTSRGPRVVNARFLEAKLLYREWLGGLGVHCGETEKETHRDLSMLLGEDPETHIRGVREPWRGGIETLERDLAGASGWADAGQLWPILNEAARYVLLNDDCPLEFLTDEYPALHRILNAAPLSGTAADFGGPFRLTLGGASERVALRPLGHGLMDPRWEARLLEARELGPGGAYRLPPREAFEWLAYKTLVHAPRPAPRAAALLQQRAAELGLEGWQPAALADRVQAKRLLDGLLSGRGYTYTRPRDPAVYFNHRLLGSSRPALRRAQDALRSTYGGTLRRAFGSAHALYLRARDRVLLNAPWLRDLKRFVPGRSA